MGISIFHTKEIAVEKVLFGLGFHFTIIYIMNTT